jgi:dihydropteroate synthase
VIHPQGLPAALRALNRTLVMGILNVTPDSFSDGGLYLDHDAAVAHGLEMVRDGADLVDVGGESTRPGAEPVDVAEEARRVVDVVRDLVAQGVQVSIDTRHAVVARECVEVGAVLVNDVSSGRGDTAMWPFIAASGVPYVLMHNRGHGASRDDLASYADVVEDVAHELDDRTSEAVRAGIASDRLILDPGIGFAKRSEHNWPLVDESALAALVRGGRADRRPVLLGASRKRFLGTRSDGSLHPDDSMRHRDELTVGITTAAARAGVWCVRVHDVAPNAAAVRAVVAVAGSSGARDEEAR